MTLSATGVCVYEQQQQHCEIVLTLSWATLVLVSSTSSSSSSSSCTAADKAEMCSMYWRCHFYLTRILLLLLPMLVSHSTQLAKHTHTHSLQCSVLTEADTLPSDSTLADPVCVCVWCQLSWCCCCLGMTDNGSKLGVHRIDKLGGRKRGKRRDKLGRKKVVKNDKEKKEELRFEKKKKKERMLFTAARDGTDLF